MVRKGTAVFEDAVHMMADALGVDLDEVVCEAGFAAATRDLDLGYMKIGGGLRRGRRGELAGPRRRAAP